MYFVYVKLHNQQTRRAKKFKTQHKGTIKNDTTLCSQQYQH